MSQGPGPRLSYVDGTVIRTPRGAAIAVPLQNVYPLVAGSKVTLAYGNRKGAHPYPVYQVIDSVNGSLRLLTDAANGPPVISDNGRFVAWQTELVDGYATVAGWDVVRRSPIAATVPFPFKPTCCDNPLDMVGIDNGGRLYANGGGRAWVSPLGSTGEAQLIKGLRGSYLVQVAGDGVLLAWAGSSARHTVGRLDPAAIFTPEGSANASSSSVSQNGRRLVSADVEDNLRVRDFTTGDAQTVPLPEDSVLRSFAWEDNATLLVEVATDYDAASTSWLRCSLLGAPCEVAVAPGKGHVFPDDR